MSSTTGTTTLHSAARNGDLAELGKCLSEDVNVNSTDKHQRTALHLAAWAGHADIIKALLSSPGIQKKACAMDQMTALHFGAMNGHTEVCRLLLNAGIPVNTKTRHEETVHMLLKRNASPFMKDSKGENALDKSKDSETCRAAVQAAMDATAASGSAFSKKRSRQQQGAGCGTDDVAAATDDQQRHASARPGVQDGSGDDDDDDEGDLIPLKRPLVAPKPAQRQHAAPIAATPVPTASAPAVGRCSCAPSQHNAAAQTQPSHSQAAAAEPAAPQPGDAGLQAAKPPVAAPMRPAVARGPSRALQAGGKRAG